MASIDDLLADYRVSEGPSIRQQIDAAETGLGMRVTGDLPEFLIAHGPGEGFVREPGGEFDKTGGYLAITPPEGWVSKHNILEAHINWPGLLIFGSDGGGEFFAYDQDTGLYVEVDAIGDPDRRPLGESFGQFLKALADRRYRPT